MDFESQLMQKSCSKLDLLEVGFTFCVLRLNVCLEKKETETFYISKVQLQNVSALSGHGCHSLCTSALSLPRVQ